MGIRQRLAGMFKPQARVTQQQKSEPSYYFPSKKANVYVSSESALELSTCFACVTVLSEDIAKLPWKVYEERSDKSIEVKGPLYKLLNVKPNPLMNAMAFKETLMSWALTWGNGYAEIERNMAGQPSALYPISPDRVSVEVHDGEVWYLVRNSDGSESAIPSRNMYHVHGVGYDGLIGYSIIAKAAQTLGFGIAAEEHGANYFGNNTTPGIALKTTSSLSDEGFDRLKAQIDDRKGSKYAFESMILEEGLDFASPSVSLAEAQFTEINKEIANRICQFMKVPPPIAGILDKAHYNNLENLMRIYGRTLGTWTTRLEQEANVKLIGARSAMSYTKIAMEGLLRGDTVKRYEGYRILFNLGSLCPNDICRLEDMNEIGPQGDSYFIQKNMSTLENIINEQPVGAALPAPEYEIDEETARRAIANKIAKYIKKDMSKAEDHKLIYSSYDSFVGWRDRYNIRSRQVREEGIQAILSKAKGAFIEPLDVDEVVDEYEMQINEKMDALFKGESQ